MRIANITQLEELRKSVIDKKSESKTTIVISAGTCGIARGSQKIIKAFKKELKNNGFNGKVELRITGCQGFCEVEPNVILYPDRIFYQKLEPKDVKEIISETIIGHKVIERLLYVDPQTQHRVTSSDEIPFYKKQKRLLLENNILVDPTSLEDYLSIGGYAALSKVLTELTPEQVIETVKKSGLRGRGGAGFPTGRKWEICRASKGKEKYVICNGDEGDPGAYMDRSVLEGNPHSIIEGMIIGGYAIGAMRGYIYVRDEYPLAVANLHTAIKLARKNGLLGKKIVGSKFNFDIVISKGSGAFVCGEETALIASIEGRRGVPKQRPPFPAHKGLWGKPTNINNVETWANVPIIINRGAEWYSSIGTEGSKGTKIFSLVGKINNTGLVEVPMGITLREIVYDIGGGIPGGKAFKAVQTGGPSGGCLPKELIDLPVDYEGLAKAGSIMGSGGMIVMDENTCMVDVAKYFLNFLRDESCGKCISCREGTQRLWEIVNGISEGQGKPDDIELLDELAHAVKDASMCGLGQTAANPVLSTLKYFKNEYLAHIKEKKCQAMVCKEIVSSPCQYACPIDQEACSYVALAAQGKFKEAFEIIIKDNPLPSACGRSCDHKCESVCRAGEFGDPISIRALKRFITDWARENKIETNPVLSEERPERVAIIGSGPAGLSAGFYLRQQGYKATIFESHPVVGGMLAVGIPDHRLPKEILEYDLAHIRRSGVEIKTSMTLGKDFTIKDLFAQGYKAVFIATGAHKSMKMDIPGEDAQGIVRALELLRKVNLGQEVTLGTKVAVIGGGNAAIDAARVAIRDKKVDKVTILYRRTRNEMPAFAEEVEAALVEGIELQLLVAPKKVIVENGKVIALECLRMKLGELDASGRRRPVPVEGSDFVIPLDTLIPAIGERPDLSFLGSDGKINKTKWDTIDANQETLITNGEGIFAGGDVVTGPNTVIQAIAHGKIAAKSIGQYLDGKEVVRKYVLTRPSLFVEPMELTEAESSKTKRPPEHTLPPKQRKHNFKEVELGLTEKEAIAEAKRCLRCELETKDAKQALGRK